MEGTSNIPGLGSATAAARNASVTLSREALETAESGKPEEAAQAFEELFARQLVREMRRGLPDGFFGKGVGADTFESWLDEHLGAELARDGALGIAGIIKTQLARGIEGVIPAADALESNDTAGDEV